MYACIYTNIHSFICMCGYLRTRVCLVCLYAYECLSEGMFVCSQSGCNGLPPVTFWLFCTRWWCSEPRWDTLGSIFYYGTIAELDNEDVDVEVCGPFSPRGTRMCVRVRVSLCGATWEQSLWRNLRDLFLILLFFVMQVWDWNATRDVLIGKRRLPLRGMIETQGLYCRLCESLSIFVHSKIVGHFLLCGRCPPS